MFLTIKLYSHLNRGLMLIWIVLNGTLFDNETLFELYQGQCDVNFLVDYCCGLKWDAVSEKTFDPLIASFVYFQVYYGTIWALCEYISHKSCIIFLIQQQNK